MFLEDAAAEMGDHAGLPRRSGAAATAVCSGASSSPLGPRHRRRRHRGRDARGRLRIDVADRDRERVGRVVRRRHGRQAEDQLHQLLHLLLLGAPVADDRALDLGGRVLEHRHARFDGRQHRDAARVAELERAAHVHRVKQILDRDAVRPALGDAAARAGCG